MAIDTRTLLRNESMIALVNCHKRFAETNTLGVVKKQNYTKNITTKEYLKSFQHKEYKIDLVLKMVMLEDKLKLIHLTDVESRKLELARVLLDNPHTLVLDEFFKGMIDKEITYFIRFLRNLINKKNKKIILITDDMNIVSAYFKHFYLFTKGENYIYIDNMFDDVIYKYVRMPYTVELVKYLEKKGHTIDHDITFNETLKAIYRGVGKWDT